MLVASLDMRARKSLGQNFLFDLNLTRRIARSAISLNGTTIEVGPGPGGLTRALLLEGADSVIAVEKDFRAATVLDSLLTAAGDRLQLVEGDALKTPLWEMGSAPRRIVANLPYNIATTLLIQWLGQAQAFESMTLMFQREVAERITAQPGSSAYGRLSILTGWIADAAILFDIPPDAFVPAPRSPPPSYRSGHWRRPVRMRPQGAGRGHPARLWTAAQDAACFAEAHRRRGHARSRRY